MVCRGICRGPFVGDCLWWAILGDRLGGGGTICGGHSWGPFVGEGPFVGDCLWGAICRGLFVGGHL